MFPEDEQHDLHDAIMRAYALRDEANDLLDQADELLHASLGLPRFDESLAVYLPVPPATASARPPMPHPRAFAVNASSLADRLDGSYHVPVAQTAITLLKAGTYAPVSLGSMVKSIYIPPRFKRIYVKKEYGVPFLRPSHLPQMRPYDLGYLSHITPVLPLLTLNKGEVLVTTDGTVGRIAVVTNRVEGWAGSNNIARITYGSHDNRNGFLAAFLSTPYGFLQLTREIYGGVIDHIETPQLESLLIPNAPPEVQIAIGERVVAAYEKKDEASALEEATIRKVEVRLQQSA